MSHLKKKKKYWCFKIGLIFCKHFWNLACACFQDVHPDIWNIFDSVAFVDIDIKASDHPVVQYVHECSTCWDLLGSFFSSSLSLVLSSPNFSLSSRYRVLISPSCVILHGQLTKTIWLSLKWDDHMYPFSLVHTQIFTPDFTCNFIHFSMWSSVLQDADN